MTKQEETKGHVNIGRPMVGAFATSTLAVLGLMGLIMAFSGYGVALAVETEFGIPHASIFKSSFDLLSLSIWLFTSLLNNSSQIFENLFSSRLYWRTAGTAALLALVGWPLIYGFGYWYRHKLRDGLVRRLKQAKALNELKSFILVSGFLPLFAGIGVLISAPLLLVALLISMSLIAIIPVISLSAGASHIQDYVIKPQRCFPVATRMMRLEWIERNAKSNKPKGTAALCVRVLDGDKVIAAGRVVFSTTEIIVLYDPKTGKVMRESLAGKAVETVAEL